MNALLRLHLLCFPPACWQCARLMEPFAPAHPGFPYLCPACFAALPWQPGAPGPAPAAPHAPDGLDGVYAACRYEPPVSRWIQGFKYQGRDNLARLLGLLLTSAPAAAPPADVVAPVPLHPRRLRERGFNQALLLAHRWRAAVPASASPHLWPGLLVRRRYTRPQVEMDGPSRLANVAGAFALGSRAAAVAADGAPLRGLRIVLVDDVMTTGSTLSTCAATLKAAGAERVHALVVAAT